MYNNEKPTKVVSSPLPSFIDPINYINLKEGVALFIETVLRIIPYFDNKILLENIQAKETILKLQEQMEFLKEFYDPKDDKNNKQILSSINTEIQKLKELSIQYMKENMQGIQEQDTHVQHMVDCLTTLAKYLTENQVEAYVGRYAELRTEDLIYENTEKLIKKIIMPAETDETMLQEVALKKQHDDFKQQEKFYTYLGSLSQEVYKSDLLKKELIAQVAEELFLFCKALESTNKIAAKYGEKQIKINCEKFANDYFDDYKKLKQYEIELKKYSTLLDLLNKQEKVKKVNKEQEELLKNKISECEKNKKTNEYFINEIHKKTTKASLTLFESIIEPPHAKQFSNLANALGFDEKEYNPNNDTSNTSASSGWLSGIAKSWALSIGNAVSSYIPSLDTVKQGFTTVGQYGVATGMGSAFGPLGMIAAPTAVYFTKETYSKGLEIYNNFKDTLEGKFTRLYSGEAFSVNGNLKSAFGEKAEIVNAFYKNTLFKLHITLDNMTDIEKDEESAKSLIALYGKLSEDYQVLRTGSTPAIQNKTKKQICNDIFKEDLKLMVKKYYQDDQKNVTEYIMAFQQLLDKNKIYESLTNPEERKYSFKQIKTEKSIETDMGEFLIMDEPMDTKEKISTKTSQQLAIESKNDNQLILNITPNQNKLSLSFSPQIISKRTPETSETESELVALDKTIISCDNNIVGTTQDLTLSELLVTELNTSESKSLMARNIKNYRVLTKDFVNLPFNECVEIFVAHNNFPLLKFWFEEKCFTIANKETREQRRKVVGESLKIFDGKTFWHLLCERSDGAEILNKLIELQKKASKTTVVAWSFADYFEPNVLYLNMNPLSYAIAESNIKILSAYLENMCDYFSSFTLNEQKRLFNNILENVCSQDPNNKNHATLFCLALMNEIANYQYQNTSMTSSVMSFIGGLFGTQDPTYMEIMSALTICLAQGKPIPTASIEILDFLYEMNERKSLYFHVSALRNIDLEPVASKISHFIKSQTALIRYLEDSSEKSPIQNEMGYVLANSKRVPYQPWTDDEQALFVALLKNDVENFSKLLKTTSSLISSWATIKLTNENVGIFNLLYVAVKLGYADIVGVLYNKFDFNFFNSNIRECGPDDFDRKKQMSALILAAKEKKFDIIQKIIDLRLKNLTAGFSRKAKDTQDKTVLHYLAEHNQNDNCKDICVNLIKTGKSKQELLGFCNIEDNNGNSPLEILIRGGNIKTLKEMDEWVRTNNICTLGISEIFRNKKGGSVLLKTNIDGLTPLQSELSKGNIDMAKFLLSLMAETNELEKIEEKLTKSLLNIKDINFSDFIAGMIKYSEDNYQNNGNNTKILLNCLAGYVRLSVLSNDEDALNTTLDRLVLLYAQMIDVKTKSTLIQTLAFAFINIPPMYTDSLITTVLKAKLNQDDIISLISIINKNNESDLAVQSKLKFFTNELCDKKLLDPKLLETLNIKRDESKILTLAFDNIQKSPPTSVPKGKDEQQKSKFD